MAGNHLCPWRRLSWLTQAVVLFTLIAAGIAAYATLLTLLKVTDGRELVNAIRRPGGLRP